MAVNVFVRGPHDQLVRPETRFWNASGIEVSAGGGAGFRARVESLQAVILGGIAFDTRPEGVNEPPSPKDSEFELYSDKDSAQNTPYGPQVSYLVHFTGSVRGIDVGTPVELLGIRVGRVIDVRLEGDAGRLRVPVTVMLDPERVLLHQGELPTEGQKLQQSTDAQMEILVARGLRAELQSGSLLTGSKVVALAFRSHVPRARLTFGGRYPEIPTISGSGFDDLAESAARLLADARTLVQGANQVLRSPGARGDHQESGSLDPRGEHPHRADDAEPPGRLGTAGEDARRDLRAAGELHHRDRASSRARCATSARPRARSAC